MMIRRYFAIILFLIGVLNIGDNIYAQSSIYKISSYGVEDGLLTRQIDKIFKDSRGYMWISSSKGIYLFNGKNFKVFLEEPNNIHLPIVENIFEDVNGNIWTMMRSRQGKETLICHSLITKNFKKLIIDNYGS